MIRSLNLLALLVSSLFVVACGDNGSGRAPDAILMVVTSHDRIDADDPTGLWLEEFAVPYKLFRDAGYEVTVASPKGGKAPVDPRSLAGDDEPDAIALAALEDTASLGAVDLDAHVAVFFPGGHGTMFDLPSSKTVQETVAHYLEKDQPTAFVCHGPAALVGVTLSDGSAAVKGRKVTGFTDAEEKAVQLDEKMPFLLETKLRELGGDFAGADLWQEHVVVDGNLITGQNPASSGKAAEALLKQLESGS